MTTSRTFTFDEDEVRSWCDQAIDHNQIHLDGDAAKALPFFEERVVPGIMVLDKVSGLISQWSGSHDKTPVLTEMNNIGFHEPIYFDDEVEISLTIDTIENQQYYLHFEADDGSAATDTLYAEGDVKVLLV